MRRPRRVPDRACATSCARAPSWAPRIRIDAERRRGPRCWPWSALDRLPRLLERLGDEAEFLSPARRARAVGRLPRPPVRGLAGRPTSRRVDYEPAESTTALFGGNSNWRGPVWFPVNYLLIAALRRYHHALRRRLHGRVPARARASSARSREIALDLAARLVAIFLPDERRPPPGVRRHRALPDRPGLARLPALPRVLPRRRRRRPRRLPPDRLDRAGGRPDHPPGLAARAARRRERRSRHGLPTPRWAPTSTATAPPSRLFSSVADAVDLCLFDDDGHEAAHRPAARQRATSGAATSPGVGPGQALRLPRARPVGPGVAARAATRPSCCSTPTRARSPARCIWHPAVHADAPGDPDRRDESDSAPYVPRAVVCADGFDWGDDRRPATPLADTIIYETHVKGFTALAPRGPRAAAGHLRRPGPPGRDRPPHRARGDRGRADAGAPVRARRGAGRRAGCATTGATSRSATSRPTTATPRATAGQQVDEFKAMVRALHAAGLEVILDVVFNHTAEGDEDGPTLCLRGIDNAAYYRLAGRSAPLRGRHRLRQHARHRTAPRPCGW